MTQIVTDATDSHAAPSAERFWPLALGAIGVVFGDIGTSPLYAMREALAHSRSGGTAPLAVLGVVSLVTWALILVVTLKYVVFLMRADNKGEGGTLALMALAQRALPRPRGGGARSRSWSWAFWAPPFSTPTASSRPPCRCSARWKVCGRSPSSDVPCHS
jgi:hypothetical protein